MTKDTEKAKKLLDEAKNRVKSKFIGAERTIDDIFKKLEIWYCHPEFLTRPTIINLWGTTGVGKTALVRAIVLELGLEEEFCEIHMGVQNTEDIFGKSRGNTSILSNLYGSDISTATKAVLLLDEMQMARTLRDKNNSDIMQGKMRMYDDMWALLSDGKMIDGKDRIKHLKDVIAEFGKRASRWEGDLDAFNSIHQTTPISGTDAFGRVIQAPEESRLSEWYARILIHSVGITPEDINKILMVKMQYHGKEELAKVMIEMKQSRNPNMKLLTSLKSREVVFLYTMKLNELLNKSTSDVNDFNNPDVFRKLLIFISGNLDEAFVTEDNVMKDADKYHAFTSSITTDSIKKTLSKYFREEQVARLGNNHVICPSLSEESFKIIIRNELKKYERECLNNFHTEIKLVSEKVVDHIYNTGVFPAQGVRPVLTSISSFIGEYLPPLLIKAKEEELKSITLKFKGD